MENIVQLELGSCDNDDHWPYDDDEDLFAVSIHSKIRVLDFDGNAMIETTEQRRIFPLKHSWLLGDRLVGLQQLRSYLHECILLENVTQEIVSFYDEKRGVMSRSMASATIPMIVAKVVVVIPLGSLSTEIALDGYSRFLSVMYSRRTDDNNSSPVPAADWSIEGLEKRDFDGLGDELECPICLEKFDQEVELTLMNCSHAFHGDCVVRWLKTNNSCPLCRSELPTN